VDAQAPEDQVAFLGHREQLAKARDRLVDGLGRQGSLAHLESAVPIDLGHGEATRVGPGNPTKNSNGSAVVPGSRRTTSCPDSMSIVAANTLLA
jgi:hypothetical protein